MEQGNQVAPAELEDQLLSHPAVADCAVIGTISPTSGEECPKAFVVVKSTVTSTDATQKQNNSQLEKELHQHVQKAKAKYKWITGGIEFVDVIPKSTSGKILRRELRDREKAKAKAKAVKRPKL